MRAAVEKREKESFAVEYAGDMRAVGSWETGSAACFPISEYQICTIFFYNFKNLMLKSSIKSSIIDKKYYFKWGSLAPVYKGTIRSRND